MFTDRDLEQIKSKGIPLKTVEDQLDHFHSGFAFVKLTAPATRDNGIRIFKEREVEELTGLFDRKSKVYRLVKFVPASGAATRMFQNLFEFLDKFDRKLTDDQLFTERGFNSAWYFSQHIKKFAFYEDLSKRMDKAGYNIESCLKDRAYDIILEFVLGPKGLNYGNLPKGVIKFHKYGSFARTAVGEHLVEGTHYCLSRDRKVTVYYTVSAEYLDNFNELVKLVRPYYENMFEVQYNVIFSIQKPSADTIAVDMHNKPFRDKDGSLVFRPGGHGALIENLNEIDADIIFIKNIDNVVPDRLKNETYKYKKIIGGLLISLQEKIFHYLRELDKKPAADKLLDEIVQFCLDNLNITFVDKFHRLEYKDKVPLLQKLLNKPIRVCGMVRNEGEPGGGPFWVESKKGVVSLQIVETSQINTTDPKQKSILDSATHFNPVDLVCGVKNYKGEKFDLHQFIDPETGFISIKSKDGRQLKAMELPGLWNGAMAKWITLFVEVPIITFNPVKVVNDLLREQHQNQ